MSAKLYLDFNLLLQKMMARQLQVDNSVSRRERDLSVNPVSVEQQDSKGRKKLGCRGIESGKLEWSKQVNCSNWDGRPQSVRATGNTVSARAVVKDRRQLAAACGTATNKLTDEE